MKSRLIAAIVCFGTVLPNAWAQNGLPSQISSTDGFTPAAIAPGTPDGSYLLSGLDTVNYSNMLVNFRFPLVKIGGRGSASTVMMPNLSPMWRVFASPYAYNCSQSGCQWGWNYTILNGTWATIPAIYGAGRMLSRPAGFNCQQNQPTAPDWFQTTLTRLTFIAPDETETEFVDQKTGGAPEPGYYNTAGFDRGTIFLSRDGTSSVFTSNSDIVDPSGNCNIGQQTASGTLQMRDGTKYTIVNGYVTLIEDRNGNQISYSGIGTSSTVTITDSVGRTYQVTPGLFDSATNRHYDQLSYPGSGGSTRLIKIYYDSLHNLLRGDLGGSTKDVKDLWPGVLVNPGGQNDGSLVSEIDLPDGSSYHFQYDVYSDVARVILPTGGAVEYDYVSFADAGATNYGSAADWTLVRQLSQRREYISAAVLLQRPA